MKVKKLCVCQIKLDVLAEARQMKKDQDKQFFNDLDSKKMLFKEYIDAVCERFACTPNEAGKLIGKHIKGEI